MTPEEIRALTDGLDALDDDALAARRSDMAQLVTDIATAADLDRIEEAEAARDVHAAITVEQSTRAEAHAAGEARLAAVAADIADPAVEPEDVEPEPEVTPDGDPPAPDVPEAIVEPAPEAVVPVVPLAAAAPPAPRPHVPARTIARGQANRPAPAPDLPTVQPLTIVAAAQMTSIGVLRGDEISAEQATRMLVEDGQRIMRSGSRELGEFETAPYDPMAPVTILATIRRDAPEERTLHARDIDGNADKIGALRTAARQRAVEDIDEMSRSGRLPGPMSGRPHTAAGGNCAPLTPVYTIVEHAEAATPFLDNLPSTQWDRGGIQFSRSPGPAVLTAGYTQLTETEDEANTAKNRVEIACPSIVTAEVEAHALRILHRNWSSRFWPEREANLNDLGLSEKARLQEQQLLDNVETSAGVLNVSTGNDYGLARDFLYVVDRAVASMRENQRISDSVPLEAHFPRWLLNAMRADLTSGARDVDTLSVGDAQLASFFADRGVAPRMFWEGDTLMGTQTDNVPLIDFPTSVEWGLWIPGDVIAGEGGELNLGTVRDSTLNATNAFETFMETWVNVAVLGRHVYWIASAVCASGTYAPAGTARSCTTGS